VEVGAATAEESTALSCCLVLLRVSGLLPVFSCRIHVIISARRQRMRSTMRSPPIAGIFWKVYDFLFSSIGPATASMVAG